MRLPRFGVVDAAGFVVSVHPGVVEAAGAIARKRISAFKRGKPQASLSVAALAPGQDRGSKVRRPQLRNRPAG